MAEMSIKWKNEWRLALLIPVIALGSVFYFNTFWIYVALLIWVLTCGVFFFAKNQLPRVSARAITDFVPIAIVMAWLYGVILGLAMGVNYEFVFRNYFGMSLYALYPLVLYSFRTRRDLTRFIWNCAVISGIILSFSMAIDIFNLVSNSEAFSLKKRAFEEIGLMAFRLHYAANSFFLLAAIAIAYGFKCKKVGLSRYWVNFILLWLMIIYLASISKGFILALLLFFFIIIVMKRNSLTYLSILFLLAIFFTVAVFLFVDSNIDLEPILLGDELSDSSARNVQLKELINDISFFGHGLGAGLENSSYVRDSNFGYSFELTYLNLIHKLGVFSILVYMAFALTLVKGWEMLLSGHSETTLSGAVVLTLMLYLIISWGNPIMFNPICVIGHMLALALINRKSKVYRLN